MGCTHDWLGKSLIRVAPTLAPRGLEADESWLREPSTQHRVSQSEVLSVRKVVVYELLSLDGVAEDPDSFLTDWDDVMDANLASVIAAQDAVILGHRSYGAGSACRRRCRRAQARDRTEDRWQRTKATRRVAVYSARIDPKLHLTEWPSTCRLPRHPVAAAVRDGRILQDAA
jgi:hypothetical protein